MEKSKQSKNTQPKKKSAHQTEAKKPKNPNKSQAEKSNSWDEEVKETFPASDAIAKY